MNILQLSAVSGALAVVLGAFGAHALEGSLSDRYQAVYETAVLYHLTHSIVAVLASLLLLSQKHRFYRYAALSFLIGNLLFAGSLYALAVFALPILGMITPLGGVAFIIGWLLLAVASKGVFDGQ